MLKNFFTKTKVIIIIVFFNSIINLAQQRIIIDEDFTDWEIVEPVYQDLIGDQNSGDVDFGKLNVLNDNDYLFIYFEVGGEINLQSNNSITIYLDTDNNSSTGLLVEGIGAELEYTFGSRSGFVRLSGLSIEISHSDIGIIAAPTVTSGNFELAINRNTSFTGQGQLFSSSTIKIVIKDNGAGGDKIPNEEGGAEFNFESIMPEYAHEYSIKKNENKLRIMTYNVEFDGLFEPNNIPHFTRIFKATEPDIIVFEEIYNKSSQQTADQVESMLPSGQNEQWYNASEGNDIIVVSRFPIIASEPIDGNGAFLLNLNPNFETELLIIGAHPPCCANDNSRQREIDAIMAFVRDSKSGTSPIPISSETPIIITGDMNLVGYAQQLNTFLTGDIVNESSFGPDFNPDWDGSNFEDAKPFVTNSPFVFTWYNEGSDFGPGRLDFFIYSGSVLELNNSYTLFTNHLPADTLSTYGLVNIDATSASDHLPVVADFSMPDVTLIYESENSINDFFLDQNYPNPFNSKTTIAFSVPTLTGGNLQQTILKVYDILGNEVKLLLDRGLSGGTYKINFDLEDLSSGVYIYRLVSGNFSSSKKMIVLK
jgi:endonuclease/exonuclease/phosphatase family metal-dependent hydrolase